jgi:UDP-N-acetylglucosamine 2-epimerase (non-hydrolysing)
MDVGALIMAGLRERRVLDAVKVVLEQAKSVDRPSVSVEDYEAAGVSRKILRIVLSYTDHINRTVWQKSL